MLRDLNSELAEVLNEDLIYGAALQSNGERTEGQIGREKVGAKNKSEIAALRPPLDSRHGKCGGGKRALLISAKFAQLMRQD